MTSVSQLAKGAHWVLAPPLLALGPIQNSQTMSAALPDPRILSCVAGRELLAGEFWADEVPEQQSSQHSPVGDEAEGDATPATAPKPR